MLETESGCNCFTFLEIMYFHYFLAITFSVLLLIFNKFFLASSGLVLNLSIIDQFVLPFKFLILFVILYFHFFSFSNPETRLAVDFCNYRLHNFSKRPTYNHWCNCIKILRVYAMYKDYTSMSTYYGNIERYSEGTLCDLRIPSTTSRLITTGLIYLWANELK